MTSATAKEIFRVTLISEVYAAAATPQEAADLAVDLLAEFADNHSMIASVTRASEPRPHAFLATGHEQALQKSSLVQGRDATAIAIQ